MKLFVAAIFVTVVAGKLVSNDNPKNPTDISPYTAGNEYRYRFDSQIALGFAETSQQKALTRIQTEAILYFNTNRLVTLRLANIQIGATHASVIEHADRIHPFSIVEQKEIEPDHLKKLALPLQFNYEDGLVERINFDSGDDVWSKNIKRAVLNLLQVNLKARNLSGEQQREVKAQDPSWESLTPRMFTVSETTIEGECATTYVINKFENVRHNDLDFFNVTKTIDFKNCAKLADVTYGAQVGQSLAGEQQEDKLAEQTVRRSTILRHFVAGTPEKFAINRAESISQYTFKTYNAEQATPMVSVVVNQLTKITVITKPSGQQASPSGTQAESLLYSNDCDRDVKRFYMYGDDEFTKESSPFSKIQNKQQLITGLLAKIQQLTQDTKTGVESEATVLLDRLVELLRTCTVPELEDIISRTESRPLELLYDTLALAATRNTIYVLTEQIANRKLSVPKAIQSLKALRGLPAPSENQIEILIKLCRSERMMFESLRQSCWLTVGTIMGELCQTSKQSNYVVNKIATNELCPRHITDKFIETLETEYSRATDRYEKILILKVIGNAGLEEALPKLEQTIYDEKEDPLVRAQAVDSMRRLAKEHPAKIQGILMPVFKNQNELTELRLQALSLIMQTVPDNGILDQVAFVVLREPSTNVRAFVYDIVRAYAKSPIAIERKLAQHLKAIVKLTGINEREAMKMGSSYAYRIPIYSSQLDEGMFVSLESMFASDNVIPKKLTVGFDSFLNGIFKKNTVELSLQQVNLEQWYEAFLGWYSDSSRSSYGKEELSRIFTDLKLKGRGNDRVNTVPFGFLSLRVRNIDYAILPLEQKTMPEALRQIIFKGNKPLLRDFKNLIHSVYSDEVYRATIAWNFYNCLTKVPTTAGIPLKLTQSIPALAWVETRIPSRSSSVSLQVHPAAAVSHVQRIEAWCPVVNSGVESVVSIEFNTPIESETSFEGAERNLKITIKVPENEVRIFSFHSLPITYVRDYDSKTHVHKEARMKTIRNERLEQYGKQMDITVGTETVHITGHVHVPPKSSNINLFSVFMTTENHLRVDFKPTKYTPKMIGINLSADMFRQNDGRLHPLFTNFYDKFDDQLQNAYRFLKIDDDNEQSLSRVLKRYESLQSYKHSFQAEIKTINADANPVKLAKFQAEMICDEQFGFCKTQVGIRRDPFFEGEDREWKLDANVETILPEYSSDCQQYKEKRSKKNYKFLGSIDCSWGTNEQQYVNIHINGGQGKTREWMELEKTENKNKNVDSCEKFAFLNKYDISAEYKLSPEVTSYMSLMMWYLRAKNYLNTKFQTVTGSPAKSTGLITALVVVDPVSRQHFNISINTPYEKLHIDTVSSPVKIVPFPLVRRSGSKSIKSTKNLLLTIVPKDNVNEECSVDGVKVRTFDDVVYKAPITKCYTLLTKDCNRDSRFAVLLKKIDNENKILKVVYSNGNIVKIEKDEDNQDKFRVVVNGDEIKQRDWDDYDISKLDDIITIDNRDATVRFSGNQAWVKVSPRYKNNLCGICGHYDGDEANEFINGNNQKTADIRQYFRSFTMKNSDCESDFEETINKHVFETFDSDNEFGKKTQRDEEPVKKTLVMEYNHKICFSMKPVSECPRGLYPTNQFINVKVQFTCLARDDVKARRFIRELKTEGILKGVKELPMSFVENVKTPTKCVEF